MDLLSQIVARAKSNKQRIVLPEAEEERTLCAADRALADGLADIILIGNPAKVDALAKEKGLTNIGKATLIDPENYDKSEELAEKLAEIRKSKGMTIEEARKLVKNPLYLGCMIIKTEGADGQISGALSTTGDTLRPALQIIKCQPGITCVSGGLLLISKQKQYGGWCACCCRRGRNTDARCQSVGTDCSLHGSDGKGCGWLRGSPCGYAQLLDEGLC